LILVTKLIPISIRLNALLYRTVHGVTDVQRSK